MKSKGNTAQFSARNMLGNISGIFHKNARQYTKYSLRFLFHLPKNFPAHLTHQNYAVLPKKRRAGRTALGLALAALVLTVSARGYTEGTLEYLLVDGAAVVTGYFGRDSVVTVPDHLAGCPVSVIAAGAFADTAAREIALPDTVDTVEDGAFSETQTVTGLPAATPSPSPSPSPSPTPTMSPGPSSAPSASPSLSPTATPSPTIVPTTVPPAATAAPGEAEIAVFVAASTAEPTATPESAPASDSAEASDADLAPLPDDGDETEELIALEEEPVASDVPAALYTEPAAADESDGDRAASHVVPGVCAAAAAALLAAGLLYALRRRKKEK